MLGPSAKAYEQQQMFKVKNQQSDFIRSALHAEAKPDLVIKQKPQQLTVQSSLPLGLNMP